MQTAIALNGAYGEQIADLWSAAADDTWSSAPAKGRIVCTLPRLPLNAGRYSFNVCGRAQQQVADFLMYAGSFEVLQGDFFGTGKMPDPHQGYFLLQQRWLNVPSE